MLPLLLARIAQAHRNTGDDPHANDVVSLLRFAGTEGSTAYPDDRDFVWTGAGNAHISEVDSKFGGGSLRLDGSGDYVACGSICPYLAGVDTFTIEMWARSLAQPTDLGNFIAFNTYTGANTFLFQDGALYLDPTGNSITYPRLPLDGTWHHMALVCDAGTFKVFQDGVLQGSVVNAIRVKSSDRCSIGQEWDNGTASGFFNGYISNFRITKAARYSGNFTPPTAPFPAVPTAPEAQNMDFETGVEAFQGDWIQTTAWASTGTHSLGSGNKGVPNSGSGASYRAHLSSPKTLTLDWHLQSESGYDKFTLAVNGVAYVNGVSSSGGTGGTVTVALPAGPVMIYALYTKDSSGNTGLDQAFIDNIRFT